MCIYQYYTIRYNQIVIIINRDILQFNKIWWLIYFDGPDYLLKQALVKLLKYPN